MPDTLITPPVRSPLMEQNRTDNTAARDWYLWFNRLGHRTNSTSQMVSYGAGDARPDAGGMPDGALYFEIDPGYVIYQNIQGSWHYVAGTMWGTLAPDQRPTDLGPNDAGFTFRTTDTSPAYSGRTFVWSGSVWVETTPAAFGTHAARLASVNSVNGELFIETDRGEVIYQNQGGTWHFLAGTMWGTISPDQRPTDL